MVKKVRFLLLQNVALHQSIRALHTLCFDMGLLGDKRGRELLFLWSEETSHLMSKIINNRASLLKWY